MCLCNFHKLRVSLKWLAWGLMITSTSILPLLPTSWGPHKHTYIWRHYHTHTGTQAHVNACTPPLLGLSVPQARLCLPSLRVGLSLHKLDFSLRQHVLHFDSMKSQKSHETKSSHSIKTNIHHRNMNQNMFLLQKADKV